MEWSESWELGVGIRGMSGVKREGDGVGALGSAGHAEQGFRLASRNTPRHSANNNPPLKRRISSTFQVTVRITNSAGIQHDLGVPKCTPPASLSTAAEGRYTANTLLLLLLLFLLLLLLPRGRAPFFTQHAPASKMANPRTAPAVTYASPTLGIQTQTPTGPVRQCYNLHEEAGVQEALHIIAPQQGVLGGAHGRRVKRGGQGAGGGFAIYRDKLVRVLGKLLGPAGSG